MKRLICPICRTVYRRFPDVDFTKHWRPGGKCRDLSQGQTRPCVGRLMLLTDWERAEWFK